MEFQLTETLSSLIEQGVLFVPRLILALVIFLIGLYLAAVFSRLVRQAMVRRQRDPEIIVLVGKISRYTTVILFTTVALQQINFNLTTFVAGLGIVGFTIGFALQDVSKNFISGLLLLLQQPFDLGDVVEVSGFTGRVLRVDLRATELQTLDGRLVQIPNGNIFTQPIVNLNRNPQRRIDLEVGIAPDTELEEARRVALAALAPAPGLLTEPAPRLFFHTFGASTINFTLQFWIDLLATDPQAAKDGALTAVNDAFAAAGIDMPFPTQRVKLESI